LWHVEINRLQRALGQTQEEGHICRRQVGREGGREGGRGGGRDTYVMQMMGKSVTGKLSHASSPLPPSLPPSLVFLQVEELLTRAEEEEEERREVMAEMTRTRQQLQQQEEACKGLEEEREGLRGKVARLELEVFETQVREGGREGGREKEEEGSPWVTIVLMKKRRLLLYFHSLPPFFPPSPPPTSLERCRRPIQQM